MEGYFSVNRSLFDNFLWSDGPFTKGQAWIDLFGKANYSDNTIFIRGIPILVKRGQTSRSELTLSDDWGWSRGKVRRYLAMLLERGMIELKQDNKTTIITICNYDQFQVNKKTNDTPNSTADGTPNGHQTDTKRYTNNKENNKNKEKNIKKITKKTISPLEDKQDFIKQLPDSITKNYNMVMILSTLDNLIDYCLSHGKTYKDYNATLRGFLKRDFEKNIQPKKSATPSYI